MLAPPVPPPWEVDVGMTTYVTPTEGTGGRLRVRPEDFIVEEVPGDLPARDTTGPWTLALIRARNWETHHLARELARALGISKRLVHYTGTKDKRAVTTQWFALRAPPHRVEALPLKDLEVLETRGSPRAPKLGEHLGNRFRLRVRDLPVAPEDAEERARATLAELVEAGGVPNFFGIQRFGSQRPITHRVGLAILQGDLKGAVHAYVGNPNDVEPPDVQEVRRRFDETGDARAALEGFPARYGFERTLLHGMVEHGDAWDRVLLKLPRNLLTLFVYAHQSALFNRILGERIRQGLPLRDPVVGDLVLPEDAPGIPNEARRLPVEARNLDKVRVQCRKDRAFPSGLVAGYDVPLAEGAMGVIEQEALAADPVAPDAYRVLELPEVSSRGIRRALRVPLGDPQVSSGEDDGGGYLELSFHLPRGAYATSVLREVLKASEARAYA